MHIKSFRWNIAGTRIELPADKAFETADALCKCPNVGIADDGTEFFVTHAYTDQMHRYVKFEGGYKEPFLLAERRIN